MIVKLFFNVILFKTSGIILKYHVFEITVTLSIAGTYALELNKKKKPLYALNKCNYDGRINY